MKDIRVFSKSTRKTGISTFLKKRLLLGLSCMSSLSFDLRRSLFILSQLEDAALFKEVALCFVIILMHHKADYICGLLNATHISAVLKLVHG